MVNSQLLKSRFVVALIDTGIGDALGVGFESMSSVLPELVRVAACNSDSLSYTDDTHMMIDVAEFLIDTKGFNGERIARTFIKRYEQEP